MGSQVQATSNSALISTSAQSVDEVLLVRKINPKKKITDANIFNQNKTIEDKFKSSKFRLSIIATKSR